MISRSDGLDNVKYGIHLWIHSKEDEPPNANCLELLIAIMQANHHTCLYHFSKANLRNVFPIATPSCGMGVRDMPSAYASSLKIPLLWRLKRISDMISSLNSG